jgi:6-phosphogluconate dehydrogenase
MVAYAEGFFLITHTGKEFDWEIDPAQVARIWQGGCIIRSDLLNEIQNAYTGEIALEHLFLSDFYSTSFRKLIRGWRKIVSTAVNEGLPMPAMSAALSQYDTLRSERLPANLIQAQRDYFGAHTYERVDRLRGKTFHTDWIEESRKG